VDLELEGKQVIAAEALPTDKFSNRRCQVENMKEEQSSSTQLLYTRNSKLVCEGDLVVEYDLDWGMHLDFLCVPSLYRLKQQT